MTVRRTGEWAKARRMLQRGAQRMRQGIEQAVRQEAQLLRKEMVQGLTRQAPGGEAIAPPSELTLAARRLRGFGGTKKP